MFLSVNRQSRLVRETLTLFFKYESLSSFTAKRNLFDGTEYPPEKQSSLDNYQKSTSLSDISDNNIKVIQNIPSKNEVNNSDILDPDGRIFLETFAPHISPTFNFAAYVNKSPTLQELVKLGVNLHIWEKKKGIPQFVLKLDFERDMKNMIRFLHDSGVPADSLGTFITKNPLIFKEKIEDLEVRINYLESKKFTTEMVAQIVTKNPYWLMFSTPRIDRRLGHFQKTFHLNGPEVRELSTKLPRLITYNMNHVKGATFALKGMMGFEDIELKRLLLQKPKLWMINHDALIARFKYVHNQMEVSHSQLAKNPSVLGSRLNRIQQRHEFLEKYGPKIPDGMSRYDPKSVGYVSLDTLVSGNDVEFCTDVAKVSTESFNAYLKSL